MKIKDPYDNLVGALIGLAIGDALGASVEFKSPGSFEPVTGYRSGGPFNLPAGYWTDDTSLALCSAISLIDCNGFNPQDHLERFRRWYREAYLSSTGTCFDIGNQTRNAIQLYERSVLMPTASLASADQSPPVLDSPGTGIPRSRHCFSQLYRVTSAMPYSTATETSVRFSSGNSFLRTCF